MCRTKEPSLRKDGFSRNWNPVRVVDGGSWCDECEKDPLLQIERLKGAAPVTYADYYIVMEGDDAAKEQEKRALCLRLMTEAAMADGYSSLGPVREDFTPPPGMAMSIFGKWKQYVYLQAEGVR